jgi:hypothetical protein
MIAPRVQKSARRSEPMTLHFTEIAASTIREIGEHFDTITPG